MPPHLSLSLSAEFGRETGVTSIESYHLCFKLGQELSPFPDRFRLFLGLWIILQFAKELFASSLF